MARFEQDPQDPRVLESQQGGGGGRCGPEARPNASVSSVYQLLVISSELPQEVLLFGQVQRQGCSALRAVALQSPAPVLDVALQS